MIITLDVVYKSGSSTQYPNIDTKSRSVDEILAYILKASKLVKAPATQAKIFIKAIDVETKRVIKTAFCIRQNTVTATRSLPNEDTSLSNNGFLIKKDIR